MKRLITLGCLGVVLSVGGFASGVDVHSYSDMPTDQVTLFPNSSGWLDRTVLGGYGITKEVYYNGSGWQSGGDAGMSFPWESNALAPLLPADTR